MPKTLVAALFVLLAIAGCEASTTEPPRDAAEGPDAVADAAAPTDAADDSAGDVRAEDVPPGIDPDDPPRPAAPCGEDLDAPNGRVAPELGEVPDGGLFEGDPADVGPYAISAEDVTIPNPDPERPALAATVFTPLGSDGAPLAGPLPLVLVFPGFPAQHTSYRHFAEPLASHGFGVVAATPALWSFAEPQEHPKTAADVRAVLDWALAESTLAARLDATKVALAGHSAGGKMSFFAAALDPRVDLVVGWDPQNGGGPPCSIAEAMGLDCNRWPVAPNCLAEDPGLLHQLRAEVLVFAARDAAFTPDAHLWAEHFYRGAPSPASFVLFSAAGHADWVSDGDVSRVTRRVHTALLLSRFRGVRGLETYLPGGAALTATEGVESHTK